MDNAASLYEKILSPNIKTTNPHVNGEITLAILSDIAIKANLVVISLSGEMFIKTILKVVQSPDSKIPNKTDTKLIVCLSERKRKKKANIHPMKMYFRKISGFIFIRI